MTFTMILRRSAPQKFRVWFVDDREENLKMFQDNHGNDFEIRAFEKPDEVLRALKAKESPDALLCDIFFYDDPKRREAIEERVKCEVEQLKKSVAKFEPEKAQQGVDLIEEVSAMFNDNPPFPVYAYTSKGPLSGSGLIATLRR
jgi:hypothetical protein